MVIQGNSFPRIHVESLPFTLALLGFFLFIAIFSIAIQEAIFGDQYRFLQEGIPYVGTIIRRSVLHEAYISTYQVTYCFSTSEHVGTGTFMVSKEQYEALELDTPLIVLVNPNASYRFILYDMLSYVICCPMSP